MSREEISEYGLLLLTSGVYGRSNGPQGTMRNNSNGYLIGYTGYTTVAGTILGRKEQL